MGNGSRKAKGATLIEKELLEEVLDVDQYKLDDVADKQEKSSIVMEKLKKLRKFINMGKNFNSDHKNVKEVVEGKLNGQDDITFFRKTQIIRPLTSVKVELDGNFSSLNSKIIRPIRWLNDSNKKIYQGFKKFCLKVKLRFSDSPRLISFLLRDSSNYFNHLNYEMTRETEVPNRIVIKNFSNTRSENNGSLLEEGDSDNSNDDGSSHIIANSTQNSERTFDAEIVTQNQVAIDIPSKILQNDHEKTLNTRLNISFKQETLKEFLTDKLLVVKNISQIKDLVNSIHSGNSDENELFINAKAEKYEYTARIKHYTAIAIGVAIGALFCFLGWILNIFRTAILTDNMLHFLDSGNIPTYTIAVFFIILIIVLAIVRYKFVDPTGITEDFKNITGVNHHPAKCWKLVDNAQFKEQLLNFIKELCDDKKCLKVELQTKKITKVDYKNVLQNRILKVLKHKLQDSKDSDSILLSTDDVNEILEILIEYKNFIVSFQGEELESIIEVPKAKEEKPEQAASVSPSKMESAESFDIVNKDSEVKKYTILNILSRMAAPLLSPETNETKVPAWFNIVNNVNGQLAKDVQAQEAC